MEFVQILIDTAFEIGWFPYLIAFGAIYIFGIYFYILRFYFNDPTEPPKKPEPLCTEGVVKKFKRWKKLTTKQWNNVIQKSIYSDLLSFDKLELLPSNSRFGYRFRNRLTIVDLFNGEERVFDTTSSPHHPVFKKILQVECIKIYPYRIMFAYYKMCRRTYLGLFYLNCDAERMDLKSSCEISPEHRCLMDSEDGNRFVLFLEPDNEFVLGSIVENNILIEWDTCFKMDHEFGCEKLSDNLLRGLMISTSRNVGQENDWVMSYCEMDLDLNQSREVFSFEFPETNNFCDDMMIFNNVYAWTDDNVCYYSMLQEYVENLYVYAFNVQTRQCLKVDLIGPKIGDLDMEILNGGDKLVVKNGQFYNCYSFRKPEKLQKIVWFQLRHIQMYIGNKNKRMEEVMKESQLEGELKPFYGLFK